MIRTFEKHLEAVTCVAWLPDGKSFISGSTEKNMYQWSIDGKFLHQWGGARVMDLAVTHDGKKLFACSDKKIKIYNLQDKTEIDCIYETEPVTSMCLSKDGSHMLVNLSISEIHLWSIDSKTIVKKYFGQKQGRFVIRSTIGGIDENFILSGSEDFHVYVWHRELGNIIENLPGHSGIN